MNFNEWRYLRTKLNAKCLVQQIGDSEYADLDKMCSANATDRHPTGNERISIGTIPQARVKN